MRKLSPFRAIAHALGSVSTYRAMAVRIGLTWAPVLLVFGLIEEWLAISSGPPGQGSGPAGLVNLLSAVVGIVAFSAMAVSWHRFILRDESRSPLTVDGLVLRYAGHSLLITVMVMIPVLAGILLAYAVPVFTIVLLPLSFAAGTVATRLSVKLPAVALGRTDFSFQDTWKATENNIWPIFGVFLLNGLIILIAILLMSLAVSMLGQLSPAAGLALKVVGMPVLQTALTLFNASVFTSLYGFFVERRDF
jgi:hypothetical protein